MKYQQPEYLSGGREKESMNEKQMLYILFFTV